MFSERSDENNLLIPTTQQCEFEGERESEHDHSHCFAFETHVDARTSKASLKLNTISRYGA